MDSSAVSPVQQRFCAETEFCVLWGGCMYSYIGVPWNPYQKPAARTEERQQFFFKADVLRQYNILREKMDARREAAAAFARSQYETKLGEGSASETAGGTMRAAPVTEIRDESERDINEGLIGKQKDSVDYYIETEQPSDSGDAAAHSSTSDGSGRKKRGEAPRQEKGLWHRMQQQKRPYKDKLSKAELQERLLDEEEEEEMLVNRSVILRKEREEAWRDKRRMFKELAENERLKFAGDGKGMPRYPLENRRVMDAPDWVLNDPMGPRIPLGYSELEDD